MPLSITAMYKQIRHMMRNNYEERIKSGEAQRLSPEFERALFDFQDEQALTCGGRIPKSEVDAKINELSKKHKVDPSDLRKAILDGHL